MSGVSYALTDSVTMLRRNMRHLMRYPIMIIAYVGQPVFILLVVVGIFGHALGHGLGVQSTDGHRYIDYVAPAMILITINYGLTTTALNVSNDMTAGIMDRFRTMAIARSSILIGHVLEAVVRTLFSIALVLGLAVALKFRPDATPVEWIAAIGLMALLTLAFTWLVMAFALATRSLEGANSLTLPLQFLPFLSSAFVPASTMPAGVDWFARNQPLTPIINTLRGLLMGSRIGNDGIVAVAWCVGIALVGYLWSKASFNRNSTAPVAAAPAGKK
ncbi:ABC transporter permease [Streptomyces sp. NPDC101165]|uniref:ABC transporter permease n=1 Tax=Streptomyces sp. NPDC101165 TaxID=3366119 RepID=UPI0037F256F2